MSQTELYREITDRVLQLLAQGVAPWRKPWTSDLEQPRNLHGGRRYQGLNRLLLSWAGFDCCYWVTKEQAERRGWTVRAGERPWPVVGYFWPSSRIPPHPNLVGRQVFNLRQLVGIARLPRPRAASPASAPIPAIERAERIVAAMPRRPLIRHGFVHACYRPRPDVVEMPLRDRFESAEEYYSALFHELVHATAHPDRVERTLGLRSLSGGLHDYSFEELIAEFGALFLGAQTGITARILDNSAAYIHCWYQALDANPTWVVQAASQAETAVDYVLGTHPKVLAER